MNFEAFAAQNQYLPFFGNKGLSPLQLHRWTKGGRLVRLKRGLYTLPEERRKIPFSLLWLANSLYSPSYLSLEFALSWYDLIPERVTTFTSVTQLKTAKFENPLGRFSYRHVKKELFFGFETLEDEYKKRFLIAQPEKALFDLLYLSKDWEPTENFLLEGLRLQQLNQLNHRRLAKYALIFKTPKIKKILPILMEMTKK